MSSCQSMGPLWFPPSADPSSYATSLPLTSATPRKDPACPQVVPELRPAQVWAGRRPQTLDGVRDLGGQIRLCGVRCAFRTETPAAHAREDREDRNVVAVVDRHANAHERGSSLLMPESCRDRRPDSRHSAGGGVVNGTRARSAWAFSGWFDGKAERVPAGGTPAWFGRGNARDQVAAPRSRDSDARAAADLR